MMDNIKKNICRVFCLASVLFLATTVNVKAMTFKDCEYSKEYIEWYNLSDKEKKNTKMPNICKYSTDVLVGDSESDANLSKFSLVDSNKVPAVRNQGQAGICWAISALSSIESNMLVNGKNAPVLSPGHMELLTQSTYPISNFKTFDREFNSGGNHMIAATYLYNYWGPVAEEKAPIDTVIKMATDKPASVDNMDSYAKDVKPLVDVDNVSMFGDNNSSNGGACTNETISNIKKYVSKYGALQAMMYYADEDDVTATTADANGNYYYKGKFINGPYYYYNGEAYTYKNNTEEANQRPNHGITIVGWDDDVDPSNFTKTPSRKGAWIIQNSYGTTFKPTNIDVTLNRGNNGYYYVSYDDIRICSQVAGYFNVNDKVSDNAYYYDYLGIDHYLVPNNTNENTKKIYQANKFTKKSNSNERLDRISFFAPTAGVTYDIYYSLDNDLNNLKKIGTYTAPNGGYVSYRPETDIVFNKNFSIVLENDLSSSSTPIAVSSKVANSHYDKFEATDNVSYVSYDGKNWTKVEADGEPMQLSIRAYTTNTTANPTDTAKDESKSAESNTESKADIKDNTNDNTKSENDSGIEVEQNPNNPQNMKTVTETNSANGGTVENPKTGIETPYIVLIVGIIAGAILVVSILSKKNKLFARL